MTSKCHVALCVALPLWSGHALAATTIPHKAGAVHAIEKELRPMSRMPTKLASQAPAPGSDAGGGGASPGFDTGKAPEAAGSQKGSVEGSYDLMQLIKKAAPQKDKK